MNWFINLFIFVPLLGFLISFLIPANNEKLLSRTAFYTAGANLISIVFYIIYWFFHYSKYFNIKEIVLFSDPKNEFVLDLFFDEITASFLFIGSLLTFLITIYSRYYLHREDGYKRFFNTILFFYLGYNVTVLSGNFETLFIGWEMLGISSFLLIAFYRNRYLPVRNAVKVFSIYRIGDVGIILAMWASHHLWHENITWLKLNNQTLVHEHLQDHTLIGVFISLMILIAAAAKSAQLPFSSWLPRAMEGPTPSSAIFYGSLSVHFGVFLLLRTMPFWENQITVRILIGTLGLCTSIIATLIARVQSSIKTQIAYSSIAQIGLIFIEISLELETLALIHFMGNAFLRTYQLLVSPSVVSYLIKEQFYHFVEPEKTMESNLPKKLAYTTYIFSLKEWFLDSFMNKWVFGPLKFTGKKFSFITLKNVLIYNIPLFAVGTILLFMDDNIPAPIHQALPTIFALIGFILVLRSFTERKSPRLAWLLIFLNHLWVVLAVSFNEHYDVSHILLYLSGITVFGAYGFYLLTKLKKMEPAYFDLNQYYGHSFEHGKMSFFFLLCGLGMMGFPISPTVIGEDLIFSHIHSNQFFLAFFNASAFIVGGISIVRMYARLFLGTHIKTYHETPWKSS